MNHARVRRTPALFALFLSFFSRALYREVMGSWWGLGLGYLYFILSLALIPVALHYSEAARSITLEKPVDARYLLQQMPPVIITGGVATANVPQPYPLRTRAGTVVAVVDTWDMLQDQPIDFSGIALGRTHVSLHTPWHVFHWPYPPGAALVLGAEPLIFIAETVVPYAFIFPWLLYPAAVMASLLVLGSAIFLLSLGAYAIFAALKLDAPLAGLMRCLAVALTPALALLALDVYYGLGAALAPPLVFIAYAAFAVWANMEEPETYEL